MNEVGDDTNMEEMLDELDKYNERYYTLLRFKVAKRSAKAHKDKKGLARIEALEKRAVAMLAPNG